MIFIGFAKGRSGAMNVSGYLSRSSGEKIEVVVEMVNTAKQEAMFCTLGEASFFGWWTG